MSEISYHCRPPDPALRAAFGITEANIKLNRGGQLSRAQMRLLWRKRPLSLEEIVFAGAALSSLEEQHDR